jgi:ABC-type lipoprotein export system ATPase subunit
MTLLQARNIHKTYRLGRANTVRALQGVDISVEAGEMVAIMGPSGCGKSTLMHILGLLQPPDRDTNPAAELSFDGKDLTSLSDRQRTAMRASTMGFVFQSFNLVPTLTAAENVALSAEYAGKSGAQSRAAAAEALEWVGLGGRGGHRPAELSGGEQQRVAIARALVNQARLVLADEPTGNLDSGNSAEVMQLLRRFNRERGQTILLVTHDQDVGNACSRILTMKDGQITAG